MADPNLNSAERLEVYQGMFLINRSFSNIVRRLEELDKAAQDLNVSRQAVIKTLVRQALDQHYLALRSRRP